MKVRVAEEFRGLKVYVPLLSGAPDFNAYSTKDKVTSGDKEYQDLTGLSRIAEKRVKQMKL